MPSKWVSLLALAALTAAGSAGCASSKYKGRRSIARDAAPAPAAAPRSPNEPPPPEPPPLRERQPEPEAIPKPQEEPPRPVEPLEPRRRPSNALLDVNALEALARAGLVVYSGGFEADPEVCASLHLRAPSPWLSRDILGLEDDAVGAFLGVGFTSLDREDLDPQPEEPDGNVIFAGAGLDYAFFKTDQFLMRAALGLLYASYGSIDEMDSGLSLLLGVAASFNVSEGVAVNFSPELSISSGDWMLFNQIGLVIRF